MLGLVLAGCQQPSSVPGSSPSTPLAQLNALTAADLQSAAAIALAANPPDNEGAQCYAWLATNLTNIQAQFGLADVSKASGVVGGFEVARLGVNSLKAGLNPALQASFEVACGPLALNTVGGINWLLARLGVTAAIAVPKIP